MCGFNATNACLHSLENLILGCITVCTHNTCLQLLIALYTITFLSSFLLYLKGDLHAKNPK